MSKHLPLVLSSKSIARDYLFLLFINTIAIFRRKPTTSGNQVISIHPFISFNNDTWFKSLSLNIIVRRIQVTEVKWNLDAKFNF